ncbi:MAG: hypothetical protein QXT28_06230 [Thermofilaceae archaeon]
MDIEKMLAKKVCEVRQRIGDRAYSMLCDWMNGAPINAPFEQIAPVLLDPERTRGRLKYAAEKIGSATGVFVVTEARNHDGKTQFAYLLAWELRRRGLNVKWCESIDWSAEDGTLQRILNGFTKWAFEQEKADVVILDEFPTYRDNAVVANQIINEYAKKYGKPIVVIAEMCALPFIENAEQIEVDVWWEEEEALVNAAALAAAAFELDDSYVPALAVFIHGVKDVFRRANATWRGLPRVVSNAALLMAAACDALKHG